MEPSQPRPTAESPRHDERVREFVRRCLEVGEREGESGVERLYASQPQYADAARRRLILLRILGFYRFRSVDDEYEAP